MTNVLRTVPHGASCASAAAKLTPVPPISSGSPSTPALVLLNGLARLIEGQRRFAEEFGLSSDRVFNDGLEPFRDCSAEVVIRGWAKGGAQGAEQLKKLMEDLVQHQLALFGALDGIAAETLEQLSPQKIRRNSLGFFWFRPFVWISYLKRHRQYAKSAFLRQQDLVAKGFVRHYSRLREVRNSSSPKH